MRMIFAVVASLAFTAAAEAATFRLGTPPVAAITLPDDWDTDEIDRGVESTSKDEEIYIAAEVASISKLEDAVTQAVAYLISEGVRIDQKTEKRSEGKIGGLDAFSSSTKVSTRTMRRPRSVSASSLPARPPRSS